MKTKLIPKERYEEIVWDVVEIFVTLNEKFTHSDAVKFMEKILKREPSESDFGEYIKKEVKKYNLSEYEQEALCKDILRNVLNEFLTISDYEYNLLKKMIFLE